MLDPNDPLPVNTNEESEDLSHTVLSPVSTKNVSTTF